MLYLINFCSFPWWLAWLLPFLLGLLAGWALWSKWKERVSELEADILGWKSKYDKLDADLDFCKKDKLSINGKWNLATDRLKELEDLAIKKEKDYNLTITSLKAAAVPAKIIVDPSIEGNKTRLIEWESDYNKLKAKADKLEADLEFCKKDKIDINSKWVLIQNRVKELEDLSTKKEMEYNLSLTNLKAASVPVIDPSIEINKKRIIELEADLNLFRSKSAKLEADLELNKKDKLDFNTKWDLIQNRVKELEGLAVKKESEYNLSLTNLKAAALPVIDPSIEINKKRILDLEGDLNLFKSKSAKLEADLELNKKDRLEFNSNLDKIQNRIKELEGLAVKKESEYNLSLTNLKAAAVPVIDPSIEINKKRILDLEGDLNLFKSKSAKLEADLELNKKDRLEFNSNLDKIQNRIKELEGLAVKKESEYNLSLTNLKAAAVPMIDPSIEINNKRILDLEGDLNLLKAKSGKLESDNQDIYTKWNLAQDRIKELELQAIKLAEANLSPVVDLQKFRGLSNTQLQIIEGIGPKMHEVLNDHKIFTWSDLAKHNGTEIKSILNQYETYNIIDPTTWPAQAALAVDGKLDELISYQKELDAGKENSNDLSDSKLEKILFKMSGYSPVKSDDLKIIEGIGPKIAELLMKAGIHTWRQLANTSQNRLKEILQAGGPKFGLADPSTWNGQARMAADGQWDELKAYQDTIG